jgi:phage shock protein PspC (stress-responsive transcriptional regulator)
MSNPVPLFKFSHAGEVFQEGLTLAQAVKLIAEKSILPTDHYWMEGMTEWKLVSSRIWANAPESVKVAAPQPVIPKSIPSFSAGASSPQPKPTTSALPSATKPFSASAPAVVDAVEKGFSPYVTYYRSNDDRWVFGIFGGLAHRNGWPKPLLLLIRLLMLFMIFPGIAYLGWGFTAMLLTPSLPTAKVRSYYDLNNGLPSQDSTDFSRFFKILVVGLILVVIAVWFASRRF